MESGHSVWLHRFALFAACAVLPLILIGGLVTSKGAGLAVPDWPNTYGHNMFLFPPSKWVGNIFYEHSHRLFASLVGLLTTVLALWLWLKEPRPWVRWLGVIAWCLVLVQGILGGLRVVLLKDGIGIVHACLAQMFFCLLLAIALFTSRWWRQTMPTFHAHATTLRRIAMVATLLVFVQLILGATMRHAHAGLAVPDFPLSYGAWIPPDMDQIDEMRARMDLEPVTAAQVNVHFAHRVGAIVTSIAVLALAFALWKMRHAQPILARIALMLVVLLAIQVGLGAWTVLSGKAAGVATLHVAVGSLLLAAHVGGILASHRLFCATPQPQTTLLASRSLVPS